jgi:hypothetical protein
MRSARGEPVARTGPEGQNGYRLDPRVGLYRIFISASSSQSAVGVPLLSGSLASRFEGPLVRGDSEGESRELVGEGDGGLVVAETLRGAERPGSDGVGLAMLRRGGEHGAGAVDPQPAQVDAAALLTGAGGTAVPLTDTEIGGLHRRAVNRFRTPPRCSGRPGSW